MFKNEASFSRQLTLRLTRCGLTVTRIESHSTGNGIPDMYVLGCHNDYWIELKNTTKVLNVRNVKVDWRPGQQAWFERYYKHMLGWRCGLTLVATEDKILIIPMNQHYKDNIVPYAWSLSMEEYKYLLIAHNTRAARRFDGLLNVCSKKWDFLYKGEICKTNREAFITWVEQVFAPAWNNYDFDPDVCWDAADTTLQLDGPYEAKAFNRLLVKLYVTCCHVMNV